MKKNFKYIYTGGNPPVDLAITWFWQNYKTMVKEKFRIDVWTTPPEFLFLIKKNLPLEKKNSTEYRDIIFCLVRFPSCLPTSSSMHSKFGGAMIIKWNHRKRAPHRDEWENGYINTAFGGGLHRSRGLLEGFCVQFWILNWPVPPPYHVMCYTIQTKALAFDFLVQGNQVMLSLVLKAGVPHSYVNMSFEFNQSIK